MFGLGGLLGLGSSTIDPASLDASLYIINYAGTLPHAGTASKGISGTHSVVTWGGTPPAVGPKFGSHPTFDFNGSTDDTLITDVSIILSTLITASAYSFDFIAQFDFALPVTAEYIHPALYADWGAIVATNYSSSGIQAFHYDGAVRQVTPFIPLAVGVKANVQTVYDGTNLKCRVNGGAWSSVATAALTDLTGRVRFGANYANGNWIDGRIARGMAFKRALTQSEFDMLYQDARLNYGV